MLVDDLLGFGINDNRSLNHAHAKFAVLEKLNR